MDFGVFGQVITSSELLLTQHALVWLDARVRAAVTRQLIRPGEPGDTRAGGSRTRVAADGGSNIS